MLPTNWRMKFVVDKNFFSVRDVEVENWLKPSIISNDKVKIKGNYKIEAKWDKKEEYIKN